MDSAPYEPRGVHNPRIIDLVTIDRSRGEVVLKALEGRRWGADPQQIDQLEQKLSNYFTYVIDGHLWRQYPRYRNLPVRIELDCVEVPPPEVQPGIVNVSEFAELHGMRFEVRVVRDPFGAPAPWETSGG